MALGLGAAGDGGWQAAASGGVKLVGEADGEASAPLLLREVANRAATRRMRLTATSALPNKLCGDAVPHQAEA
jgi:hypothetical protein